MRATGRLRVCIGLVDVTAEAASVRRCSRRAPAGCELPQVSMKARHAIRVGQRQRTLAITSAARRAEARARRRTRAAGRTGSRSRRATGPACAATPRTRRASSARRRRRATRRDAVEPPGRDRDRLAARRIAAEIDAGEPHRAFSRARARRRRRRCRPRRPGASTGRPRRAAARRSAPRTASRPRAPARRG